MSTDIPGEGNDDLLEKIRRYQAEEQVPKGDSGILSRSQEEQKRKILFLLERKEKLLGLQPRSVVIDPESPETSPDLLQMENIYNSRLVPDKALLALENGDTHTYLGLIKFGGMYNRFHPTDKERELYPEGYQSVREQVIADVLGTSEKPGSYRVQGLFDAQGIMRAYLSYRLPPKKSDYASEDEYCREMQKYVNYLQKLLELTPRDLRRSPSAATRGGTMDHTDSREKIRNELPSMWEIDTINVERGWGGASLLVLKGILDDIEREFGRDALQSAFCYRFLGLRHKGEIFGENAVSRDLFETRLGFSVFADRNDPNEVVAREIEGECYQYKPKWAYLYCPNERMKDHLGKELKEIGLAD